MEIQELSRNVHLVKVDSRPKLFICSDIHFDSKQCDRDLFRKHLKRAEDENRLVIINGDFFDLMQGRYDPRSGKYDIRPEYKHANYLDQVIESGVDELSKYNLKYIITQGNHETNILKRLETNPTERMITMLKYKGIECYMGAYAGWVVLTLKVTSTTKLNYRIKYHHGHGGGKRSKGILSADIDRAENPDADMLIKGHDHNKWSLPVTVERLNTNHEPYMHTINILRTGSYKLRNSDGNGWDIEKDFMNPRLGGWYVDLSIDSHNGQRRITTEILEAK